MAEQVGKNEPGKVAAALSKLKGKILASNRPIKVAELPELPEHDKDLEESGGEIKEEGKTFSQLFEESQKGTNFKEGEVVEGVVVKKDSETVTVDIGYKSEGNIRVSEFFDNQRQVAVDVGDHVLVYIEKVEDDDGRLVLSKEKADVLRAWDEISEACEKNELVEGTVISKVKGGLSVDIGVKAFLPGSQVDVRPTKNLDQYLGQTFKFKIIKFNKKRGNIVLSRRLLLMEERARLKEQTLANIEEGMVTQGTIKNLTDYGAFIDLGGLDGLLHITDMSWGRIKHPSELFKVGDNIEVKVLKYDEDKERVSLGYKQLQSDPWGTVEDRYTVGMRVKGKVVSLTDYGAFVELEPGVEGLVHVSEMSWTQRVKHPSKIVNDGDLVEAVVLDVDKGNRRISLGMKQIEPNPWDLLAEKYAPGTRVKGTVKNITDFGVFVGVPEGIDGLVHVSDISWENKGVNPAEMFKKGDEIECVVLSIDKEAEKFSLGIKQMSSDPWQIVADKYRPGTRVNGKVTKVADFGVFIEIEEGVEGLLHASELAGEGKPKDRLKEIGVGNEMEVMVTSVDMAERKLSLSIRAMHKAEERENVRHYTETAKRESRTSFGDLLGDVAAKLKQQAQTSDGEKPASSEGKSEAEEPAAQDLKGDDSDKS
ncbi:MAG: 30S ribosomal protein S1 [Bdellovibrionales bacterium]|nr:30S ribosomal protein S1 [Bdellovibrionales bacterium]